MPLVQSPQPCSQYSLVKQLCQYASREIRVFQRYFFKNMLFDSTEYREGSGKRNNTICSYQSAKGREMFGEIRKFCEYSPLGTLVFVQTF